MKDKVWCIFYNDDDGFTCSFQTLVGVFLTEEDAKEALKKYCTAVKTYYEEILPRIGSLLDEASRRYKKYSREWIEKEREINAEINIWCRQNDIDEDSIRHRSNYNIEYYEINEVPLEKIF